MADETPSTDGAAPAPKSMSTAMLLAISLGAAAVGGGAGALLVAPKLLASAEPADSAGSAAASERGEQAQQNTKRAPLGKIFRLDNMIVNPAGSEGTHFLMASVAFEVENDRAESVLKEREVELRDLIVTRLESMTMAMLSLPTARDSLKAQLGREVLTLLGPKAKVKVYLPQFVIQ
jgi:flagellar FliL protein